MNTKEPKEKDRNLPILDYFDRLQIEYFVNEIRKKIYPTAKDKGYYRKVMEFKKQKIVDIASRNKIPCIFDDASLRAEFIGKVYPDVGLPKFELDTQDIVNYFHPGCEVKVIVDGELLFGKISSVELEKNVVFVKLKGRSSSKPFKVQTVTRIL